MAVTLELSASDTSAQVGENVLVSATLTNNSTPLSGELVNFSADMGTLSGSNAITNATGVAFVWLNSTRSGISNLSADYMGTISEAKVTYLPAPISSIDLNVSSPLLTAGVSSIIDIIGYDIFGNTNTTANFSVNMTILDVGGNPREPSTIFYTSPGNQLSINISNDAVLISNTSTGESFVRMDVYSECPCSIIFNVSSDAVLNSTVLEDPTGVPYRFSITYDDEHTVNTTSAILAMVYDVYSNPVNGSIVNFTATSPENTLYNSPNTYNSVEVSPASTTTDQNGLASAVFRTDKLAGANTVNVSVFGTGLNHVFEVNGLADHLQSIVFSNTPSSCYANYEDYYRLGAQPADQFLNPILPSVGQIKEMIYFTGPSSGSTLIPLNEFGIATTKIGPTPYVENISITAAYRNESGTTNINSTAELSFTQGELSYFKTYTYPSTVLTQNQTGTENATIVVAARDQWGHIIPNVNVQLNNTNTSLGTIYIGNQSGAILNATTDSFGEINVTFVSGDLDGNCSIIVSNGSINATSYVEVTSSPFVTSYVTAEPSYVTSGGIVNVTTVVSVQGNIPFVRDAGIAVLVLDRSGSMDPDSYAGAPIDVVLVIDRSGSMRDSLTDALTAAKQFTSDLVSNSQVGVVSFATFSTVDLDLTPLNSSDNRYLIGSVIDDNVAAGYTAMGEAIADANEILITEGRSSANKVVIVLTDGRTNRGADKYGIEAIDVANSNGITIYTIGLGSNLDEPILQRIARETGGTYYNAPTGSELENIYHTIAQDLSDYDVTSIVYGEDGFTPYRYEARNVTTSLQMIGEPYLFTFDAWDIESPNTQFKFNGHNEAIPSTEDQSWETYSYDVSDVIENDYNMIYFYTPSNGTDEDNAIRNVRITANGMPIAVYPDEFQVTRNGSYLNTSGDCNYYEETFIVNESLNDLKIKLDWTNASHDLDLYLLSPSGHTYGKWMDTTGYYPNSTNGDLSEYIWLMPLSYVYPEDDSEVVETGNWTVRVLSSSPTTFDLSSYIDKKSATKLASSAFLTNFDDDEGDKAGLVLYSEDSLNLTANQSSYVRNGSQWVGYFTVDDRGIYTFDLAWDDASVMDLKVYEGIDMLNSTQGGSSPINISSVLDTDTDYKLVVEKTSGNINDSAFNLNVSATTAFGDAIAVYYDSASTGTPRYRIWNGDKWSWEDSANYVSGGITYMDLESSPSSGEMILGTVDNQRDVNFQIYNESWGAVNEFSTSLYNYTQRGFDLAYEQSSSDAIAVYSGTVPKYRVWNGSSWSLEQSVNDSNMGAGDVRWVVMDSNPNSDEVVLVTLDDARDIRAQVWNGSSWDNPVTITNESIDTNTTDIYQCFDVVYEQQSGDAIVVWSDNDSYVHSLTWNGSMWGSEQDLYNFDYNHSVYWIEMASDTNSDNIILGMENFDYDIYANMWDGDSWDSWVPVTYNCAEYNKRIFDMAFETQSGRGMIAYGDNSETPKYRLWGGSSWSGQFSASASTSGSGYTRWVRLENDPHSDAMFLMSSDASDDVNIRRWDGSSWAVSDEIEMSSSDTYENFGLAFANDSPEPMDASVVWNLWSAWVASSLEEDIISLHTAVNGMKCEGLTAIDEGFYEANNELEDIDENTTIILMSDGIDNAGSHSLLEQAQRAKEMNTTIYTVGLGKNESEIDPVLMEIASMTGGEYYFAPNSTVLESIFEEIASQIITFTVETPSLSIHIPHNYISQLSVAKATYIANSSNSTEGNLTSFFLPTYPGTGTAEPEFTRAGDRDMINWSLPDMEPGDHWGVFYQLKVEGAGSVPIILPTSSLNFADINGTYVDIAISLPGETSIGGFGADVDYVSIGMISIVPESPTVLIDEDAILTLKAFYSDGNPAIANMQVYSSIGAFNETENPMNITVSGSDQINLMSTRAGTANIKAIGSNGNNSVSDDTVVYIRPKGVIMLS